jgi:predicted dehydrogenase
MFRALLVGCGAIGSGYRSRSGHYRLNHLDALIANPFFHIARVFDINYEHALAAGRRAQATPSVLLDELSKCKADLAVLAGPDGTRLDHVSRLVKNSSIRLIICEKPLGVDKTEADKIINKISRTGKVLITNYIRSWDDPLQKLIEDLKQGEFGLIRHISVIYSNGLRNTGSHLLALLSDISTNISVSNAFKNHNLYNYTLYLDAGTMVDVHEISQVDHPVFEIIFYTSLGELHFEGGGQKVFFKKRVLSEWDSYAALGKPQLIKDSFYSHLDRLYELVESAVKSNSLNRLDNTHQSRIVENALEKINAYAG